MLFVKLSNGEVAEAVCQGSSVRLQRGYSIACGTFAEQVIF